MAILFRCRSCSREVQAEPELAGQQVRCSGCGETAVVPSGTGELNGAFAEIQDNRSALQKKVDADDATRRRRLSGARELAQDAAVGVAVLVVFWLGFPVFGVIGGMIAHIAFGDHVRWGVLLGMLFWRIAFEAFTTPLKSSQDARKAKSQRDPAACPNCEFKDHWDGRHCGHCGHTVAGHDAIPGND